MTLWRTLAPNDPRQRTVFRTHVIPIWHHGAGQRRGLLTTPKKATGEMRLSRLAQRLFSMWCYSLVQVDQSRSIFRLSGRKGCQLPLLPLYICLLRSGHFIPEQCSPILMAILNDGVSGQRLYASNICTLPRLITLPQPMQRSTTNIWALE
ncbi:hypothetical protein VTK26DRAFT_7872 [Humicola hyalothermophila]